MKLSTSKKAHIYRLASTKQSGFTLIELMITVFIVSIMAAVALPSYRQYLKKNTESQLASDMLLMSGQLNQWRAKALTYANFTPKAGYTNKDDNMVTSPLGRETPYYNITIRTIIGGNVSKITDATTSNNWIMIATPIDEDAGLNYYAMTSTGVQCFSNSSLTAEKVWMDGGCGTGGVNW